MINHVRFGDYFIPARPDWFLHYGTAGGGITMNLGAHCIDNIQFLSGSRVKSLRASTGKYAEGAEVEGNAQVFAQLENGVTAAITLSGYNSALENEIDLVFTKGTLKLLYDKGMLLASNGAELKEIPVERAAPFALQFKELARSINEDTETAITGEYGKSVIHAIKSIYASSENKAEIML
jgi:predicted dehydrogenase